MTPHKKQLLAKGRRARVRQKISGTAARPRMSVKFSGQHIYVQFIDDTVGKTLAAVGSRDKAAGITKCGANARNAEIIGRLAAEAAKSKGLSDVLFDKGGARYHGKVRALAEAARGAGLKF